MAHSFQHHTAQSYDKVAAAYARHFRHELSHKPFDRKMLELLAERCPTGRPICDMGCGPGHIGDEVRHLDDWLDQQVNLDFAFFETDFMLQNLQAAGYEPLEVIERGPYPEEVPTRRAYLFARKP